MKIKLIKILIVRENRKIENKKYLKKRIMKNKKSIRILS